jgi:hypothetical protein
MAAMSTNVPAVADVIAEFHRALREPLQPAQHGVLELLLGLHHNNALQWDREDAARRDDAEDRAVADAKRDIDALNTKRHEYVEAIDAALAAVIDQSPSAPPTTESPAMVFDRLSVLVIRIASTEDAARANGVDRVLYAARLPVLHEQLESLQAALEALFDDVRAGRKRFVPYRSLKLYGGPGSSGGDSHPD